MIVEFVGELAKILRKTGRLQQFVFLADRSIELLQGNLKLIRPILLRITIGYRSDIERHEYADVLKYYLEVEKMFDDSVPDKTLRMLILLKIGKAFILSAQYRKTLEYTLKAEIIAIEVKHKQGEAWCCNTLGNAYIRLSDFKNAITSFQKGLEISTAIGNRSGIASNIGNLGIAYIKLGDNEKAITYYLEGLEINSAIGNKSGMANNNVNLGNAYRNLGENEKSITYYQEALEINSAIGDQLGIATSNGNLGSSYCNLGE